MTVRNAFKQLKASLQALIDNVTRSSDRLFKATDDSYPATGAQPFEGEITR